MHTYFDVLIVLRHLKDKKRACPSTIRRPEGKNRKDSNRRAAMEDQTNLNDERSNLKCTSSVHDVAEEKPPFGSRYGFVIPDNEDTQSLDRLLTDEAEVWTQNAWDHVPPPNDQDEIIAASLTKQRSAPVPEDDKRKYYDKPAKFWYVFILFAVQFVSRHD